MQTVRRMPTSMQRVASMQRMATGFALAMLVLLLVTPTLANGPTRVLLAKPLSLRSGDSMEWTQFTDPHGATFETEFELETPEAFQSISWRQFDVKQAWIVELNGLRAASLIRDENSIRVVQPLKPGVLVSGTNRLRIRPDGKHAQSDDIRLNALTLHQTSRAELLSACRVAVRVIDADSGDPLPTRLTLTDSRGVLQPLLCEPAPQLAIRHGTVYSGTGQAEFSVAPGRYRLYAGRGFEYSLAQLDLRLKKGESRQVELTLRREVDTSGWVACDPHIHSRTHSGHGDATVEERMVTLAAEGIELPIATDHNVHIDYRPFAEATGMSRWFTPVVGNEYTTPSGHFNIFPTTPEVTPPDPRLREWPEIARAIQETPGVRVAILNHARDLHSGVRPFGPQWHNEVTGANRKNWPLPFNAMEIINSSATQSQLTQLTHDWMTLLNRGERITPIGSSDSHDVARHFVGQGRTYIRVADHHPGRIHVEQAVQQMLAGEVTVSYGLLVELEVKRPEGLAMVTIKGPHWVRASDWTLFANGQVCRRARVPFRTADAGVIWKESFRLPKWKQDVILVLMARGPGIELPCWRTAKPYQPTSPEWRSQVLGVSGAVYLDIDGQGFQSARDYAKRDLEQCDGNLAKFVVNLAHRDLATVIQAADLWIERYGGDSLLRDDPHRIWGQAEPHVRDGFLRVINQWRRTR